jgi:hypothetical protein
MGSVPEADFLSEMSVSMGVIQRGGNVPIRFGATIRKRQRLVLYSDVMSFEIPKFSLSSCPSCAGKFQN